MANNKKQHFIPRCYLKRFARGKIINLFNLNNNTFYNDIAYSDQFQKSYFYDEKLKVEKMLSEFESLFDQSFKNIDENLSLTAIDNESIFTFAVMQKNRNESSMQMKNMLTLAISKEKLKNEIKSPNFPPELLNQYYEKLEEKYEDNSKGRPLRWSIVFKLIQDEVKKINQSEYIIECIENISDIDFIVSDNPVISYNNSKKELHKHDSDFSKENIMIFPINFKKIIII